MWGSLLDLARFVEARQEAEISGCVAPVVISFPRPDCDAADVFAAVKREADSFCFGHGATTVIGTEPARVLRLRGSDQEASGPLLEGTTQGNVMSEWKRAVGEFRIPEQLRHEIAECNGVAFGFVAFDAIRIFEPSVCKSTPADNLKIPESVVFVCTSLVVLTPDTVYISALCPLSRAAIEANHALALARIADLRARVDSAVRVSVADYVGQPSKGVGVSNFGRDGYHNHVKFLKSRIVAGDMVQTVPSHRVLVETPSHPFNVWRMMRKNASKYSYYVECRGGIVIVGASPELLVSVVGNGKCETHPIAGTRRRGKNAYEDEFLKQDLLADKKELAEHVMLVDLGRNDLNRVCENVTVPRLMQVDFFSHVMHIVSSVTGKLRADKTPFDAFQSVFPAGTVSGAPKLMAVEHIYHLEKERRGLYAGALGFFDLSGREANFCIAIRTLLWTGPRRCFAQAGGGIVLDSDEEAEYQETLAKMGGVLAAVKAAEEQLSEVRSEAGWPTVSQSAVSVTHNRIFESHSSVALTVGVASKRHLEKGCVLLVDNYDSFTFNLYQLLSKNHAVNVVRNNEVTVQECIDSQPSHIVLGPGPCSPLQAGICAPLILACEGKVPILGVCLGMEVMVVVYGGKIDVCGEIKHGKTSAILHDGLGTFAGVTQGVDVTRYHSLAAFADDLKTNAPKLVVTSVAEDSQVIMGVRHVQHCVEGLQFHPESIKTDQGVLMIDNFLSWNSGSWLASGPLSTILQRIVATIPPAGAVSEPQIFPFATVSLLDRVLAERPHVGVIAEVKRASPSKGDIATAPVDAGKLAFAYSACAGVCGVSVLTEPLFFKGTLGDLTAARHAVETEAKESGRPRCAVLRKDFIIHPHQLMEARISGADAVLLIVAILSEVQLSQLLAAARRLAMEPLVEVANELELERAIRVGAKLIGVNARDLHSFNVSVERAGQLVALGKKIAPSSVAFVALSGVSTRDHVVAYRRCGADAVLVGEHLMLAVSVPRAVAQLQGKAAPPLLKICGICSAEDALQAVEAGADLIGLIFAPRSKRCLTIEQAREIIAAVRTEKAAKRGSLAGMASTRRPLICGVFAGQTEQEVASIHAALHLDVVQFSGEEGVVFRPADGTPIVCAVSVSADKEVCIPTTTDVLLFDTDGGGSGKTFDWIRVRASDLRRSILAGGLTVDNVAVAVSSFGPLCVDVCSGVEEIARVKDHAKVRRFIRLAHSASSQNRGTKTVVQALVQPKGTLLQPTASEVALCLEAALADSSNAAQIGALLTALAIRTDISHSSHVLLQCRSLMMSYAVPFKGGSEKIVLDIVGTGGDGMDTFNASTAAALVVASIAQDKNVLVAKHGNRSSSGKCGSADFYEAVGGELSVAAAETRRGGFSFLFAPAFHPAMAAARQIRRDVGVRTIFNLLGPLMNPALPSHIVLGVSSLELGDDFAAVLCELPHIEAALIVHAKNGLDEISPVGETEFWRIEKGRITNRGVLNVSDFGIVNEHRMDAVVGGSAAVNASLWRQLIGGGSDKHTALVDFVCMNAAAALWITGLAPSLKEGTKMAKEALASGRVKNWASNAGLDEK